MKRAILLWIPALFMLGGAAIFSIYWVIAHVIPGDANFAVASSVLLAYLSPVIIFIITRKIMISRKPPGGKLNTFIDTAICTTVVIMSGVIATLGRQWSFQVFPWEIYAYYVVIAVCEECYYRLMMCAGIILLLSSKNKIVGVGGSIALTAITITAGFQVDTMTRVGLLVVSTVIFTCCMLITLSSERKPALWMNIFGIIVSAITFSLAHAVVYARYPEMLVATLVGGGVMAFYLVKSRSAFVPFVAHMANNIVALRGIMQNATMMILVIGA